MELGGKGYKKGLWTAEEDRILMEYVRMYGNGKWNWLAKMTGLNRSGKSCRLRWVNYLNPSVKHGQFTEEEDDLIIRLHNLLGNRWSLIAGRVPGRTDNQVKNHWNTYLSKKVETKARASSSRTLVPVAVDATVNMLEVGADTASQLPPSNEDEEGGANCCNQDQNNIVKEGNTSSTTSHDQAQEDLLMMSEGHLHHSTPFWSSSTDELDEINSGSVFS